MGIKFGTMGNLCMQIRAGALSGGEAFSRLSEAAGVSIGVIAVSDSREHP
jgi:hypothetical protein